MNPAPAPKRGEVYWLDFSPSSGHEMSGAHPCLVVQNDIGNQHSGLTIVAAITSNLRAAALPVGVMVPAGTAGLTKDSVIHCGHLYTVDKQRLEKRAGVLPSELMEQVDVALAYSLDLP